MRLDEEPMDVTPEEATLAPKSVAYFACNGCHQTNGYPYPMTETELRAALGAGTVVGMRIHRGCPSSVLGIEKVVQTGKTIFAALEDLGKAAT